jgi:hypothetical protein
LVKLDDLGADTMLDGELSQKLRKRPRRKRVEVCDGPFDGRAFAG